MLSRGGRRLGPCGQAVALLVVLWAGAAHAKCPITAAQVLLPRAKETLKATRCGAPGTNVCSTCVCAMYAIATDSLAAAGQPAQSQWDIFDCAIPVMDRMNELVPSSIWGAMRECKRTIVRRAARRGGGVAGVQQEMAAADREALACLSPAARKAASTPSPIAAHDCPTSAKAMAALPEVKKAVTTGSCAPLKGGQHIALQGCKCWCELLLLVMAPNFNQLIDSGKEVPGGKEMVAAMLACTGALRQAVRAVAGPKFDLTVIEMQKLNAPECLGFDCSAWAKQNGLVVG